MTAPGSAQPGWGSERRLLDGVAERAFVGRYSVDEEAALRDACWAMGQDIRLREDIRFRETPWQRWILLSAFLANDAVYEQLRGERRPSLEVETVLEALDGVVQRRCVLCAADPRLVVEDDRVRLSARELSALPLIESSVIELERYVTHLPIHTLRAAAASEPAGQWGQRAQDQVVETLGWLRVNLPGRKLTQRMFVAQIEGHSMDDGRTGILDGGQAVFEFGAGDFDQQPIVLARGAFHDPETGSYAVKRIRLEHAAGGEIARFRLMSANADKARYPDIVVDERAAPAVTVLARFIAALGPNDYARRPKHDGRAGRRDLTSPEGVEKQRARLATALTTFFGPAKVETTSEGGTPPEVPPLPWAAHMELPACDPGALVAVCGPLVGLLSRVQQVAVMSGTERREIFAANVRTKRWRERVAPSSEPYVWAAVGFEEDLAEDMAQLTVAGLPAGAATVFRIGADGAGQRLAGASVTPGSAYRLLVPPGLASVALDGAVAWNGWRALDLEVPSAVPAEMVNRLRALGVGVGTDAYAARWAVTCPRDYRQGRDEELYPCFSPGDAPCVAIEGPPTLLDGELQVVIQGERGSGTMALPPGGKWLVEIGSLTAGNYVLEVLPLRTSVETTRLYFGVDERARVLPRAEIGVRVREVDVRADFEDDLAELGSDASPMEIVAPPLWPVVAQWQSVARLRGRVTAADEDGRVNARALLGPSHAARRREAMGELTVDFGELGLVVLRHRRDLAAAARVGLTELVRERGAAVSGWAGELDLLRSQWLEPVCEVLGYELRALPAWATLGLTPGFTAIGLEALVREGTMFVRKPATVLVVPPAGLAFAGAGADASATTQCLKEAMLLCKKLGLGKAIVTNGRWWASVLAGHRLMVQKIDLEDAVARAALGGLDEFLGAFLVELRG